MVHVVDINEVRLERLTGTILDWQARLLVEALVGPLPEGVDDGPIAPQVAFALGHVHRMLDFALGAAAGEEDALVRLRRVKWRLRGMMRVCERRGRPNAPRSRRAAAEAMAYRRCVRELRDRMQ